MTKKSMRPFYPTAAFLASGAGIIKSVSAVGRQAHEAERDFR
jgi:hypothetical protein